MFTTGMGLGYLRKNGVPYSESAILTEYFYRMNEPNGDRSLMLMIIVEDPQYLDRPAVWTMHLKKVPDES